MRYEDFFGNLTLEALKRDPIEMGAGVSMLLMGISLAVIITRYEHWGPLWRDWLTSMDHKKIGIMYLVLSTIMLFKGIIDALMMRAQQVLSVGESFGYLDSSHYQELFTAHGTTMIFFVATGFVFALINFILPLQIGARDVAFPFLNNLSFWLFAVGCALVIISLNVGHFSGAGWAGYPPLSSKQYSPDVGVDYWLWSIQISGIGTTLSGINFLVTIFKMRCPGMTLMKMPLFVWSTLVTLVLIVFAFPILTATLGLLSLDRLMGMHFFTSDLGGNPMMYINLFWAWGHPEVYILTMPVFGIYSEVVATFSGKRLFGYTSMVWALVAISFLSFVVWVHHFFTMGAGPQVNAFFGWMTMIISIPTGVKIFNWLFTMYKGRVRLTTPMLWFIGFVIIFTLGGMDGVLMSLAPADFQLHNSLFLIAHFHSMLVGGVLFGLFCGYTYWFPKIFGFRLEEKLGIAAFYCWIAGFMLSFIPLYILGLMGATRRLDHYDASTGWRPLFIVAAIGVVVILIGIGLQVLQLYQSFRRRHLLRDTTGDPWDGRTLEWATASPPPVFNFAVTPEAGTRDPFWEMKKNPWGEKKQKIRDIHMPKNSAMGVYIGAFSFLMGFGLIWQIFWLASLSVLGVVVCIVVRLSETDLEYTVTAQEIERTLHDKT